MYAVRFCATNRFSSMQNGHCRVGRSRWKSPKRQAMPTGERKVQKKQRRRARPCGWRATESNTSPPYILRLQQFCGIQQYCYIKCSQIANHLYAHTNHTAYQSQLTHTLTSICKQENRINDNAYKYIAFDMHTNSSERDDDSSAGWLHETIDRRDTISNLFLSPFTLLRTGKI